MQGQVEIQVRGGTRWLVTTWQGPEWKQRQDRAWQVEDRAMFRSAGRAKISNKLTKKFRKNSLSLAEARVTEAVTKVSGRIRLIR